VSQHFDELRPSGSWNVKLISLLALQLLTVLVTNMYGVRNDQT